MDYTTPRRSAQNQTLPAGASDLGWPEQLKDIDIRGLPCPSSSAVPSRSTFATQSGDFLKVADDFIDAASTVGTSYPMMAALQPTPGACYGPTKAGPQPIPESLPLVVWQDVCLPGPLSDLQRYSLQPGLSARVPTPCSDPGPGRWQMELEAESDPVAPPLAARAATWRQGHHGPPPATFTEIARSEGGAVSAESSRFVPSSSPATPAPAPPSEADCSLHGGTSPEWLLLSGDNSLLQFLEDLGSEKHEDFPAGQEVTTAADPPTTMKLLADSENVYSGGAQRRGEDAEEALKWKEEDMDVTNILSTKELGEFLVMSPALQGGGGWGGLPGGKTEDGGEGEDRLLLNQTATTSLTIDDVNVKLKKKYQ